MLQYFSPLHTGVHLAKILGGLDLEHLGTTQHTAKGRVWGWNGRVLDQGWIDRVLSGT